MLWEEFDTIFIGRSAEFMLGRHAKSRLREAGTRGKWAQMGRVNTQRRMRLARAWGWSVVDVTRFLWVALAVK